MKKYIVEVYESYHVLGKPQYRWCITHRNGKIIAVSSESYKRKSTMMRALNNLLAGIKKGEYEVTEK